jgi:hypothetical protein
MKNERAPHGFLFALLVACVPPAHPSGDRPDGGRPDAGLAHDAGVEAGVDSGIADRVLFVGNSFTAVNDVPGHYRALVSSLLPAVSVEAVTPGGYTWAQDWQDAQADGTALARWLRTGSPADKAFTAVVLQEQSQLGGFPIQFPDRADSVAGATGLAGLARANGAFVVLYLTWGYEHGDPSNDAIDYETYAGMQRRLDEGYVSLAAKLSEQLGDVRLAPVGGGFRIMYEDSGATGQDPAAAGSDFDALYESDGIHPSVQGAYLAACIIAGTITSADVRQFPDEPTLGARVSARLRDVGARALADPRWHVPRIVRPRVELRPDPREPCDAGGWQCVHAAPELGRSVALSADGTRALIEGGIYERTDAGWVHESVLPSTDAYDWALSADGARALATSFNSARVYQRSAAGWTEEATLAIDGGPGCVPYAWGRCVLAGDGDRVVLGGATCWGDAGTLVMPRVLVRADGGWGDEAQLPAKQVEALDARGARALGSSDDGGVARVFTRTGSTWAEEATLVPSVATYLTGAGFALSADGSRALARSPFVTMYDRVGTSWTTQLVIPTMGWSFGLPSGFDASFALSADGRRVAVGMPDDSSVVTGSASGIVRVYDLDDGGYRPQFLLVPLDAGAGDAFGAAVAMSSDGRTVLVGAPGVGRYEGAVYTFALP